MGNRLYLLLIGICWTGVLFAQTPELVYDLNPTPVNNFPRYFQRFDSTHFTFHISTQSFPNSIWISDGTESGTRVCTELDPIGPLGGFTPLEFGEKIFIYRSASGGGYSEVFYFYDKKTKRLQPIYAENGTILNAAGFPVINGETGIFTARTNGQYYDIYRIQTGDTVAKKIFTPNSFNIIPNAKTIFETKNGLILAYARNNTGTELFKLDIDNDTIQLLLEIDTGNTSGLTFIQHQHAGYIYFQRGNFTKRNEIWRSDGTDTGTHLFQMEAGSSGNISHHYYTLNDSILYIKIDGGYDKLLKYNSNTNELITLVEKSPQSTYCEIKFLGTWPDSKFIQINDGYFKNYLNLNELQPDTIWLPNISNLQTIGQAIGSGENLAIRGRNINTLEESLFIHSDSQWKKGSVNTEASLTYSQNSHFFFVEEDSGRKIVTKDTLISNELKLVTMSKLIKETTNSNFSVVEVGGQLFVCTWEINGTSVVFQLEGAVPKRKMELSGNHLFIKIDSTHIYLLKNQGVDSARIYKYDPDLNKLIDSNYLPPQFAIQSNSHKIDGKYFFIANHSPYYGELWYFDPGSGFHQYVQGEDYRILGVFKQRLYFEQDASWNLPKKIWNTNGQNGGLVPFTFNTSGKRTGGMDQFCPTDSLLFFTASDSAYGTEMWVTNGTSQGTNMLFDLRSGVNSSSPGPLIRHHDSIYFLATVSTSQRYIYVADLKGENLRMLSDSAESASRLLLFRDKLFFNYRRPNLYDLVGVYDIKDGSLNYLADSLAAQGTSFKSYLHSSIEVNSGSGPFLYLNAFNDEFGREVWKTDGTTKGTKRITDLFPGKGDANPSFIANRNDTLYFGAYHPLVGAEIWRLHTGCLFIDFEVTNPCQNEANLLKPHLIPFDQDSVGLKWIINQSDTLSGDTLTYPFTQNGTYSIQLDAENNKCKKSRIKQVFVGARTLAKIDISEDTLCFNGHFITADVSDSNTAKTFVWSWGDGRVTSGTVTNHQFDSAGEYSLWVVGSEKGSCLDSQYFPIAVYPNPPTPAIIGPYYSEQISDTFYTNNHSGSTYFWSSDAGTVNQLISDSAVSFLWKYPTGYATVFLYEENKFRCSSLQRSHLIQRKQIQSLNDITELLCVFPNPVTSFVQIKTNGASITSIVVLDMNGKQLMKQPFSEQSESFQMNLQSLPPGPYLLKINTPTSSQFQIIIRE